MLVKGFAHWLVTGLPLARRGARVRAAARHVRRRGSRRCRATLLVGTPALTFIGAVGAALTASLRRGGLVLSILVLPLMIPVLIFGVSAANAATGGTIPFLTPFLVLCGLTLFSLVIGCFAAAALRCGHGCELQAARQRPLRAAGDCASRALALKPAATCVQKIRRN